MTLAGFKASNHPQQTGKRGADDTVDDMGTPREFFDPLSERFGGFTLDVAAAEHNAKCADYYDRDQDGLNSQWYGNVWCNPPYSDCGGWVRKAWTEWNRERRYLVRCSLCGPATFTLNGREHGKVPLPLEAHPNYGPGGSALRVMGRHEKGHRVRDRLAPDSFTLTLVPSAPELIVMLLPANRVEQGWWQDHVEPYRDKPDSPLRVEFLRGRMRFDRPGWTKPAKGDRPPFGNCLLIWSAP